MGLIKLKENVYYIDNTNKIGVITLGSSAYLIDSGNNRDCGKKILRLLRENNFELKGIINTHSHADHIGGNKYLSDETGCGIYSSSVEKIFIENNFMEASLLYAGKPFAALKNKFLMAESSNCLNIDSLGYFNYFSLSGHSPSMIGVEHNGVYFIGDALFSEAIINKYHIMYIYDVAGCLNTLDYLEGLTGIFVMSHAEVMSDITDLIKVNRAKILEVKDLILSLLDKPIQIEEVLKRVLDHYDLVLDINQYVLVGSTIRSFLSYLIDLELVEYTCSENYLLFKKKGVL